MAFTAKIFTKLALAELPLVSNVYAEFRENTTSGFVADVTDGRAGEGTGCSHEAFIVHLHIVKNA